ncbi:MAG: hypothetical protein OHK0012_07380 [Synechococcales cyanobacterium]
MGRGGARPGAGAKGSWESGRTKTIRVPESLADDVLELARRLDEGETFDSDTESNRDDVERMIGLLDDLIEGLRDGDNQLEIASRDKAACRRGFTALREYLSENGIP